MTRRTMLLLAPLLLAASAASAQELGLVRSNPVRGEVGGVAFDGSLKIKPDASYVLERRFRDGRVEREEGLAGVDEDDLVLSRRRGVAGAIVGASSGVLDRYERDDGDDRARFRFRSGNDWTLLSLREDERKIETVWRLLKKGREWNWVFKRNRGQLDEAGGDLDLRIYRSRQPRPKDVLRFKDKGVKTILSLNGDQDKTMKHWVRVKNPDWPGRGEQRYVQEERKVNLRQFIADQGIEHHFLRMSSKRAPSEADIVAAFRILLDDSKKPILLHCTGGADRTGVIGALYRIEFMGWSKEDAKREMRKFMWGATRGTEIQGAYIDLYQVGTVRRILRQAGVPIPARYAARP